MKNEIEKTNREDGKMKQSEIKEGLRVMTEDGAGTILDPKQKYNIMYGYPETHIPVRLDKPAVFCGDTFKSLVYHYSKLTAI
jgi:hypothetical protein